jgi:VWFA-related protein
MFRVSKAAAVLALCLGVAPLVRAQDSLPSPAPQPPAGRFEESVEVERVLMDVRVLDSQGKPVRGLLPEDLKLSVDGKRIAVESVKWIDVTTPTLVPEGASEPVASGRSVVLLFQKDLDVSRSAGFLRMTARAHDLIDGLPAPDRIAVVSFDTRLRLWLDLTTDRQRAKDAIDRGVVMNKPQAVPEGEGASLRQPLSEAAARRATSLEKAMRAIGEALAGVPGERSLVLVGSHMGRNPNQLIAEDYEDAQRALSSARVAVYSLDVTDADHHSLEVGLQQAAADTGGFYARTHDFAAQATERVKGALEGHYLVAFPKPAGAPGFHSVAVRLARGGGTVLARPGYQDGN